MYSTEAIVLKKTDIRETDVLYTIYSREFGKMRALATGVKKEDAKLKGHCEPLNLVSVRFVAGKTGERLTHAVCMNPWIGIRREYEKLSAAYMMGAYVDRACFPGEKDEALWEFLIQSFEELEQGSAENFLSRFEQKFSVVLGNA